MPKSIQDIVDFYTPYFMGTLDTLVLLADIMDAADQKEVINGIVLSIVRDAVVAAQEKKE